MKKSKSNNGDDPHQLKRLLSEIRRSLCVELNEQILLRIQILKQEAQDASDY